MALEGGVSLFAAPSTGDLEAEANPNPASGTQVKRAVSIRGVGRSRSAVEKPGCVGRRRREGVESVLFVGQGGSFGEGRTVLEFGLSRHRDATEALYCQRSWYGSTFSTARANTSTDSRTVLAGRQSSHRPHFSRLRQEAVDEWRRGATFLDERPAISAPASHDPTIPTLGRISR